MTAKYYFRNLALRDLGVPADEKVLELYEYITERLSNLNQYISDKYPDYIFYGKLNDIKILNYNKNNNIVNLDFNSFSEILYEKFELQTEDIRSILIPYVEDAIRIKVNHINTLWLVQNKK